MTLAVVSKEGRYFWSGWFAGYGFSTLAMVFVLLSAVDLLATVRLLPLGVQEGNALAVTALRQYGLAGFALYKTVLVGVILLTLSLVERRNARLAHAVLWGANLLMTYIALLHVSILSAMVYLAGVG